MMVMGLDGWFLNLFVGKKDGAKLEKSPLKVFLIISNPYNISISSVMCNKS